MEILLNGERRDFEEGTSLFTILESEKVPDRGVIVAVNEKLVRRDCWDQTPVRAGDSVEIITAFEGG